MIVYAAVDLLGGRAVQLVGGRVDQEHVSWPKPAQVAARWIAAGFRALHVVDLNGAFGTGDNGSDIATILAESTVPVQVSGGVRDEARISALLRMGAARVVVGTRAVEDPVWRETMTQRYPKCLLVAADMRAGRIVKRGWTEATGQTAEAFIGSLAGEPLAGVLVTDVSREGSMRGVNVQHFAGLVETSAHPVIAAGGIRDMADLSALASAGVAGAVIGMALYTGSIQPHDVVKEFAE